MPIRRLDKSYTATTSTIGGDEIAASTIPVKPHIQPGVLQPAVAGKLLDGTTDHSGAYGTAQSDGHSYYYTDIKGSKPIKDPRIGGHFGSQRHMCKSLQSLEQETATHGEKVYSVDGREWIRVYGRAKVQNGDNGHNIQLGNDGTAGLGYCEIVGYFTTANLLTFTWSVGQYCNYDYKIDGGSWSAEQTTFQTSANSPLGTRYVDRSSVGTVVTGQTLGIHTLSLKIPDSGDTLDIYGIELIAQDTTSTANKSKIQIPSQNVVSYGKKFTVSGTPHYDPFDGMSGAKTLTQLGDYIDTATSLGMENWKGGTSNYYKPFNGGRVIKWVDSSGTIKTSVNMMPPNAQNISATASNAVSDAHIQAGTNDDTINFDTTTIANATPLSEVAKTFHIREFGNGAANGGTGHATLADASMLNATVDDIAYVMDDGLTSISGDDVNTLSDMVTFNHDANGDYFYFTFIGTGVGITVTSNAGGTDEYDKYIDGVKIVDGAYARTSGVITQETLAQNLPYGTHILKLERTAVDTWNEGYSEITFHQPKRPPVPEDAVVIADYMLMADFVPIATAGIQYISKGTRFVNCSRDVFHEDGDGITLAINVSPSQATHGIKIASSAQAGTEASSPTYHQLPMFGTNFVSRGYQHDLIFKLYLGTTDKDSASTKDNTSSADGSFAYLTTPETLGVLTARVNVADGQYDLWNGFEVVTPIHTSSHYQPFETPYLYELVGGDRNMEQTNLIVTPDGKSWDEVTRDTSYIGNSVLSATVDGNQDVKDTTIVMEEWRGNYSQYTATSFNKDFAIAYDKVICLKDGWYEIYSQQFSNDSLNAWSYFWLRLNGAPVSRQIQADTDWDACSLKTELFLKRGDYMDIQGLAHVNEFQFQIKRLRK